MPGGPYNTHLIGKAVTENDWKRAYEQMKITNNIFSDAVTKMGDIADFKGIFKSINPKKTSFFVSAYNSFLWNNRASSIVKDNTKSKLHLFENVGELHLPIDHLSQCPLVCEVDGHDFMTEKFSVQSKMFKRNLIVATTVYARQREVDELHKGKKKITVSFFLPTGSYATMIIKQIFLRLQDK
jgi:tRNA pseudouridine13 synthase